MGKEEREKMNETNDSATVQKIGVYRVYDIRIKLKTQ